LVNLNLSFNNLSKDIMIKEKVVSRTNKTVEVSISEKIA
jgi:hypothetical protein